MKGEEVATSNGKPARSGFHPIDGMRDWWADAPQWQRYAVYIALIVFALILPAPWVGSFMSPDSDWTTVLIFPVGTYILLAVGLNIVVGHAGLLDLGFVAFFAIGAYTWASIGTSYGWSYWPTVVLGIFLASVSGASLARRPLRPRVDSLPTG